MDMSASKMQKGLTVKDEIDEKDTSENKLYVGLSPFMNFAFGFTEVAVLSSIAVTLEFGLGMAFIINNAKKKDYYYRNINSFITGTGGPAALFWTYFTNSIITIFIGYSMAELCAVLLFLPFINTICMMMKLLFFTP